MSTATISKRSPLHLLGRLLLGLLIGIFFVFVVNMLGHSFDFYIPFNLVTIVVAGFLGIPGMTALVIIQGFIL